MKKLLFLVLLVATLVACDKEDEKADKFFIKPDAMILIKPAQNTTTTKIISSEHLSAKEIVKQSVMIVFYNKEMYGNQPLDIGFSDMQRDTTSNPPMLKRWATDLINRDGEGNYYLVLDLITGENFVFCRVINNTRDTIAYTPNAVIRKMEQDIYTALTQQDTTLAYEVFNNGFTFTPITGEEWQALKKQGLQ